jgi:hypothetical protein
MRQDIEEARERLDEEEPRPEESEEMEATDADLLADDETGGDESAEADESTTD